MSKPTELQRVAFSPAEFAALFGKSQTWGYRQIYAKRVTVVPGCGRILIPAKDVEKLLATAGIYNGLEKPKAQKARLEKLPEREQDAWRRFLGSRRSQVASAGKRLLRGKADKKKGKVPGRIAKSWKSSEGKV